MFAAHASRDRPAHRENLERMEAMVIREPMEDQEALDPTPNLGIRSCQLLPNAHAKITQDFREKPDHEDPMDLQETMADRALMEAQESPDPKDHRENLERMAARDKRDPMDHPERLRAMARRLQAHRESRAKMEVREPREPPDPLVTTVMMALSDPLVDPERGEKPAKMAKPDLMVNPETLETRDLATTAHPLDWPQAIEEVLQQRLNDVILVVSSLGVS